MPDSNSNSLLAELRTAYFQSLAGKLRELATALEGHDFKTVRRLGHQLKGSGLSYGFPEISELGSRLEDAGDNRRVMLLEPLFLEFKELMRQYDTPSLPEERS